MTRVPGGAGPLPQAPTASSPGSWPFPTGRALAGWWRQLETFHPRSLWVSHLLIHQVEALARSVSHVPLHPFVLMALDALLAAPAPTTEAVLAALHLEPAVLAQLLRRLQDDGLIHPGPAAGSWEVLDRARQAIAEGGYTRTGEGRRLFHFVVVEGGRPEFVRLAPVPPGVLAESAEPAPFDAALLRECVGRSAEWKSQRGFPADVTEVLGVNAGEELSWPRVVVDRPAIALIAFVVTGEGHLLGFGVGTPPSTGRGGVPAGAPAAAASHGWVLEPEPMLRLGEGWGEVFQEPAVGMEAWRQAWRGWCQPRSIPPAESEACVLERADHRLVVRAPKKLVERLRIARSDALKGEAWVLAGAGATRAAALLEVVTPGE